jgi:DNA-binding CsgD family transcriptional regulator
LLPDEEKIVLKEDQLLNTELRIFALIRMGIHDHDRIAKILDYSVTTIYTYKTRVRNKANVSHEEFDRRVMQIPVI